MQGKCSGTLSGAAWAPVTDFLKLRHSPGVGRIAKQLRQEIKDAKACQGAVGNPRVPLAAAQLHGAWQDGGMGCLQG